MKKGTKNTKKSGILHFRIFKWSGRYLGICKETGFVEEDKDFDIVREKLSNGTVALLEAIYKSSQNLEPSLNTRPPLKYLIYYYIAPILGWVELIRDDSRVESGGFYAFTKPIGYCNG